MPFNCGYFHATTKLSSRDKDTGPSKQEIFTIWTFAKRICPLARDNRPRKLSHGLVHHGRSNTWPVCECSANVFSRSQELSGVGLNGGYESFIMVSVYLFLQANVAQYPAGISDLSVNSSAYPRQDQRSPPEISSRPLMACGPSSANPETQKQKPRFL